MSPTLTHVQSGAINPYNGVQSFPRVADFTRSVPTPTKKDIARHRIASQLDVPRRGYMCWRLLGSMKAAFPSLVCSGIEPQSPVEKHNGLEIIV